MCHTTAVCVCVGFFFSCFACVITHRLTHTHMLMCNTFAKVQFHLNMIACFFFYLFPCLCDQITSHPETTRSFIYWVKLFDSHCEASIIMHNTLLLYYHIMHGRETLMCSPDKSVLILEKPSCSGSVRGGIYCTVVGMSSL